MLIALKSGLFGLGGGAISVPYMTSFKVPIKKATGTSSAFTFPISIIGTISFICVGFASDIRIDYNRVCILAGGAGYCSLYNVFCSYRKQVK